MAAEEKRARDHAVDRWNSIQWDSIIAEADAANQAGVHDGTVGRRARTWPPQMEEIMRGYQEAVGRTRGEDDAKEVRRATIEQLEKARKAAVGAICERLTQNPSVWSHVKKRSAERRPAGQQE
jgi:hypothetical protein